MERPYNQVFAASYKIKDISWLKEHKWPGLQAAFSIERIVEVCGRHSRDTSAIELMELAREHWKIGRGKVCVNDKNREYEKVRLSQEWKQEPIQEGVEEK